MNYSSTFFATALLASAVVSCAATDETTFAGEANVPPIASSSLRPTGPCTTCDFEGSGGGSDDTPYPDLRPVPGSGGTYAVRDKLGRLVVRIKNFGDAPAGASVTRITWIYGWRIDNYPTTDLATGPLEPDATQTFYLSIPSSCFDPSCDFSIMADATYAVGEKGGDNNSAGGTCVAW